MLDWLYKLGYVNESNDKIIELGLQRIKSTFTSIAFSAIVSWLMGDIIVGLLFELTYIPIRIYAGGYHASSKRRCEYLSYGSLILCMILVFYVPIKLILMNILILMSGLIIFLFSPIESPHKKLNNIEKKIFRRKSIIYMIIGILMYVALIKVGEVDWAKTIMISISLVSLGLILTFVETKNEEFCEKVH